MALDNTLQDCSDLPNSDLSDSEIVQDYKKLSKKHGTGNTTAKHKKVPLQPAGPRVLILGDNLSDNLEQDLGWDLIAFNRIGGTKLLKLLKEFFFNIIMPEEFLP